MKSSCQTRFIEGITVSMCDAFGAPQVQNVILDTLHNVYLSKVNFNKASEDEQMADIDLGLSQIHR